MSTVTQNCKYCQDEFLANTRELKRGNAKFCSQSCSSRYRVANLPVKKPNATCAFCTTSFYMSPSKKKVSKSGLFFCCRNHKDEAQRIGGLKEIQPAHFGTTLSNYRDLAKRNLDFTKCSKCGYNTHVEILEVNHKDCNRSNNSIDNLEILCPNCHSEYHFLTKTGTWAKRTSLP